MRSHRIITVFVIGICFVLSGCDLFVHPGSESPYIPHAKGTWIGRIEAVELYDSEGGIYHGAILRVEQGAMEPGSPAPESLGGGKAPLLTEYFRSNYRMIEASKLPIGKRVELTGTMMGFWATAPYRASPYGDISVGRKPNSDKSYAEHIIIVKGKPKVLQE